METISVLWLTKHSYYLLRHPGGWDKAVAEIDSARQEGRCEGAVVSYGDAAQLPYLQAVIKEGLRMLAPVSSKSSNLSNVDFPY